MDKKNITILFVDDEPVFIEALKLKLESEGFNCVTRMDMSSGWEYLQQENVSVLVTDIMMPSGPDFPDIDSSRVGYHFVNLVKNKHPDVYIICLSVIGDREKINMLKRKGVLYLRKGETSLSTAFKLIESKALGFVSY